MGTTTPTIEKDDDMKVKVKKAGRRPRTGVTIELGQQDARFHRLSQDQKTMLIEMARRGMLDTNDLVALQTGNKGSVTGTPIEDMTPEQRKRQRNTARKTGEKLAARGLVVVEKVPHITERRNRNGEIQKGRFGFLMQYKLAPGVKPLVEKLASPSGLKHGAAGS